MANGMQRSLQNPKNTKVAKFNQIEEPHESLTWTPRMFLFYTGLHWYFVGWSRIQILNQISMFSIWWSEFTEADLSTGSPSLKYLATKTYYWKRKRKLFLVGSSSVGRLNLPPTQPYPIPRLASRHQTFQKNGNNPINDQQSTPDEMWKIVASWRTFHK